MCGLKTIECAASRGRTAGGCLFCGEAAVKVSAIPAIFDILYIAEILYRSLKFVNRSISPQTPYQPPVVNFNPLRSRDSACPVLGLDVEAISDGQDIRDAHPRWRAQGSGLLTKSICGCMSRMCRSCAAGAEVAHAAVKGRIPVVRFAVLRVSIGI